jgi:hypothetical protein
MVESGPTLIEREGVDRVLELVETDQGLAADQPHGVAERPDILVEHRIRIEESPIPGKTPGDVAHRESDVGDSRELSHGGLLASVRRE